MSSSERRANSARRSELEAKLRAQIDPNANRKEGEDLLLLKPLKPDDSHWLGDASQVAELLIEARRKSRKGLSAANAKTAASTGRAQSSGRRRTFGAQHFTLGAQLDADAALAWFASGSGSANSELSWRAWPRQVCRQVTNGRGRASSTDCSSGSSGNECLMNRTELADDKALGLADLDQSRAGKFGGAHTNNDYEDDKDDKDDSIEWTSAIYLSRVLVFAAHLLCVCADIILIGTLFRVRKSRVSSSRILHYGQALPTTDK